VVEDPFLTFPTDGKTKAWALTAAKVSELRAAFPALDVMAECRKALAWLQSNPERRKTDRGMPRFLFNWMSRSQNSRPSQRNGQPADQFAHIKSWVAKGGKS
jgi:hypothetical protein